MKPDTVFIDNDDRFAIGYFARVPDESGLYTSIPTDDWAGIKRGMKLRAVYSLEDFDEKIAIFEEGLDDVAIERLKFFITHFIDPRLKSHNKNLRFSKRVRVPQWVDDVENGALVFSCYLPEEEITLNLRMSMGWYYDHLLACEFDLRMKSDDDSHAMIIDSDWMKRVMFVDPGLTMPYYRTYYVNDSDFYVSAVTIRKTVNNPTIRLYGLGHDNGAVLFPPQFSDIQALNDGHYLGVANGNPYMISSNGGLFDVFQRHLPPEPVIDYQDYLKRLCQWVFKDIKFYYRDTEKEIPNVDSYKRGDFIRAGFFVDTTSKLHRPADNVRVRFLIMSSHALPLCEIPGLGEDNPQLTLWDLNIFQYNDVFKVMDVFRGEDITQITLLQMPPSSKYIVTDEKGWSFLDKVAEQYPQFKGMTLVEASHIDLLENLNREIHPLSLNREWQERTTELIGIYPDGTPVELEPIEQVPAEEIAQFDRLISTFSDKDKDVIPRFSLQQRNFNANSGKI